MRSDPLSLSADIAAATAGVFVMILGTGSQLNHTRAVRKCTHNPLKLGKGTAAVSIDCLNF